MYDDTINPPHYAQYEHQPIHVAYERWGWRGVVPYALKYLMRCGDKDPVLQELKKARSILDMLIEREERAIREGKAPDVDTTTQVGLRSRRATGPSDSG